MLKARGPLKARVPWKARGPFAGKGPFGANDGPAWQLDVTAAQIRNAISDVTKNNGTGFLLPGQAAARLNQAARTSAAMQIRSDGMHEFAPHNLLTYSSQFDNAAWTKVRLSIAENSEVAPDGTLTADKLVEDNQNNTHYADATNATVVTGAMYTASFYAKAAERTSAQAYIVDSGIATGTTSTFNLSSGTVTSGAQASITSVGNGWYRCTVYGTVAASTARLRVFPNSNNYQGDGTSGIYVWGAQINLGTVATPYVPTTTAAVYAPAIDWLSGIGAYGLRSEAAATNLALRSRDLTQAAWTATNATTAKTATGIDGVANSASVVTATDANATVLQAITHASEERTLSIYLKRRTGTGTVETTIDGGSTWVARTLTTDWQRFTTTATLANPSVGIRIVTSGDAVDVDGVQVETGALATSPIFTFGATATRAADTLVIPDTTPAFIGQAAGTLVADYVPTVASSAMVASLNDATANERVLLSNDGVLTVTDGGAAQATPDGGTPTVSVRNRIGAAYAVDDFAVSLNGGAIVADTSGTLPATTRLTLGTGLNGSVTRIRVTNRRLPDGTLQSLTK